MQRGFRFPVAATFGCCARVNITRQDEILQPLEYSQETLWNGCSLAILGRLQTTAETQKAVATPHCSRHMYVHTQRRSFAPCALSPPPLQRKSAGGDSSDKVRQRPYPGGRDVLLSDLFGMVCCVGNWARVRPGLQGWPGLQGCRGGDSFSPNCDRVFSEKAR